MSERQRKPAAADAAPSQQADPIDRALYGIRKLQEAYYLERMIFIAGAFISLVLATAIAVYTLAVGEATLANMIPLLGSSGAFMTTGFGAMFYFGKSFDLLRDLALATRNG